jgi:gliding motility-associated-like protein
MTLAASPTGTNYAYAWSGPGTILNGSTENPVVDAGGNYVVTITNGVNGCTGSYTVNVPSNTVTPTLTLTPSSLTTTCANPTATLLATSSSDPDASYTWTAPVTGSLNNTTTSSPVANGSGVFTVQVTNTVSGCVSAVETVTITADANVPTLNTTVSSTAICSGSTATLSITGADSYTWSTTETAPTITVSPTTTTTYTATGTNTLTGCSNITNVTINVTPTPTITVAASNTTICEGNTTILTLTGGTSYTVTNPQQTTTGTLTLSPTAQTTYTITGESQGCASTTETITIDVNTLPQITTTNTVTCEGTPVVLTANGADTYTWSTTANTSTTTVTPTNNTTYTVTGTNTLTGCSSTITTVDVTVNALPTVTATANPNTTCTSGTVNLTANTTATSYTWTTGNGVDNTNQNQGTISFPASTLTTGAYIYTVTATDANGCVSIPATTTINIIDVPNANFDLSDLNICQNDNGTISINTPQTGVSYDWNINGQTITNTNPLTLPSSITNTSGTYTVNVIAGIGSCTNTAANTLTVNALPTVALINPIVSACENATAQLDVASPVTTYTYSWTNGSNTSTGANLTVNPLTPSTQGEYTVTVVDQNGCVNRTTGKVDMQLCETYVPEFFSPNGDGKNDGFVIKNIENYPNNKLKIFNRWGNLVYQKDGYLNEFEGYANTSDAAGKEKLPSGTYYVILDYGDGKTEVYNGYLQLQY